MTLPEESSPLPTTNRDSIESANGSLPRDNEECRSQPESQDAADDVFVPFEDVEPDTQSPLTFRAVVLGSLCGALVNAANVYLGFKTGWTFTANIIGSIVGFSVLKKWAASSARPFGPHENNIVQTVATASGGMSSVFVSAIPAMYQLGLLRTPPEDFPKLVALAVVCGYFGLFAITPLRRFFIHRVARDLNLVFPTSMATAITIRGMHSAASGAKEAQQKMRVTVIAFVSSVVLRIISQYAIGIFWDWHVFTWLKAVAILPSLAVAAESWGWYLEWSPAMIGTGMLVSPNVAFSFFAGSTLAWGIIGPYLVSRGMVFGEAVSEDPQWQGLMSYISMSTKYASADHPSARHWLLWPGVAGTLTVAFTELACQWPVFWVLGRSSFAAVSETVKRLLSSPEDTKYTLLVDPEQNEIEEPSPGEITTRMWAPGLLVVIVAACFVTKIAFGMPLLEAFLALFLAFFASLVTIQATGATDTTPVSAVSKTAQVLLSGTARTAGSTLADIQRLSLLGGSVTSMGANQATDLMADFRVGFLLKTPPRPQYIAQLLGTFVAAFVAPALFVLFTSAYPCIIVSPEGDGNSTIATGVETCEFPAPAIAAWRAVAVAASEPVSPIPPSSLYFSLAMAAIGCSSVLLHHFLWTGSWAWVRKFHPNMMILALAFTIPTPQYGITMMLGAVVSALWRRRDRKEFQHYGFAVAAGLIAGEGVGGTINCALSLVGLDDGRWKTTVGCPAGRC